MKISRLTFAAIAALCCFALSVSAKSEMQKVYIFGFAASFNDSTVYFTNVQQLDSAWIDTKSKFLLSRENYSSQLGNYLAGKGLQNKVCVVSFDTKEKNAEKKLNKMVARYSKAPETKKKKQKDANLKANTEQAPAYILKFIEPSDFTFENIKPYEVEAAEAAKAEKEKEKKGKKEKKNDRRPPMDGPGAGTPPPMGMSGGGEPY